MKLQSRRMEQGMMYAANPRLCLPVGGPSASSHPAPFLPLLAETLEKLLQLEPERSAKVDHTQVAEESDDVLKQNQKTRKRRQRRQWKTPNTTAPSAPHDRNVNVGADVLAGQAD